MSLSQSVRDDVIKDLVARRSEVHAAISVGAAVIGTITAGLLSLGVAVAFMALFKIDPNNGIGSMLFLTALLAPGYVIGRVVHARLRQRAISRLARENDQTLEKLHSAPDSTPGTFLWWVRDFLHLPTRKHKLSEHASVLHEQAKSTVVFGTIAGFLCGTIPGGFVAALWAVGAKLSAIVEGSQSNGVAGAIKALVDGPSSGAGAVLLVIALIGALCGFVFGNRRAFQLRSMATIALAMDRIESKLDAHLSKTPDSE